jgi:hypothetical protein
LETTKVKWLPARIVLYWLGLLGLIILAAWVEHVMFGRPWAVFFFITIMAVGGAAVGARLGGARRRR